VKDFENFGARTIEIRVAVAKIWQNRFWGPICNFWKVVRPIFGIIFGFQGSVIEIVGCGLISNRDKGSLQNWIEFLAGSYFSMERA
jgi:hypothetical protein